MTFKKKTSVPIANAAIAVDVAPPDLELSAHKWHAQQKLEYDFVCHELNFEFMLNHFKVSESVN